MLGVVVEIGAVDDVEGEVRVGAVDEPEGDVDVGPVDEVEGEVGVGAVDEVEGEVRVGAVDDVEGNAELEDGVELEDDIDVGAVDDVEGGAELEGRVEGGVEIGVAGVGPKGASAAPPTPVPGTSSKTQATEPELPRAPPARSLGRIINLGRSPPCSMAAPARPATAKVNAQSWPSHHSRRTRAQPSRS